MIDALILRDNVRNELMQIKDIETGIQYLNALNAYETWVKRVQKDAELQLIVSEQKLRTQRILGQLIKDGQKNNEILTQEDGGVTSGDTPKKKLSDIGLTRNQSSAFQKIATIPTEDFEEAIAKHKDDVEKITMSELTTSSFLRLARDIKKKEFGHDGEKVESFDRTKLTSLRIKAKLSQHELGLQSGVELSTISRLESGEAERPTFDTVARIVECFKMNGFPELIMDDFKTGDLL